MSEWLTNPWLLAIACFVIGWIVAKLGGYLGDRSARKESNKKISTTINGLKAEVNVATKDRDILGERVKELEELLAAREQKIEELETAFEARTEQFEHYKSDLKESVSKTRELRAELMTRAEDTVRAEVHARDVENELEMLQGSGDLLDAELLDTEQDESEDDDSIFTKSGTL